MSFCFSYVLTTFDDQCDMFTSAWCWCWIADSFADIFTRMIQLNEFGNNKNKVVDILFILLAYNIIMIWIYEIRDFSWKIHQQLTLCEQSSLIFQFHPILLLKIISNFLFDFDLNLVRMFLRENFHSDD